MLSAAAPSSLSSAPTFAPRMGTYTLEAAKLEATKGHSYSGWCYIVRARDGGHYLSSHARGRCDTDCKGGAHTHYCSVGDMAVARFDRTGAEHPLRVSRRGAPGMGASAVP